MGLIIADRLRDLFEGTEALGLLAHECLDLVDAFGFDPRCDIDHNQRGRIDVVLADGDQAGSAAHRCADQHRAPPA